MRRTLLEIAPDALGAVVEGTGRARAVFATLRRGADPFSDETLSSSLRKALAAACMHRPLEIVATSRAVDGSMKLALRLPADGSILETVVLPGRARTTACVSTQVGCARACVFCASGERGLLRNASQSEILGQILVALRVVADTSLPTLRNIVFMGMGEPLDNLASVRDSIATLIHPFGFVFAPRHITLSTVAPTADRVAALADIPVRIAWSLHASDDDVRRVLVPTQRETVDELARAFHRVFAERRDPLFVECTLVEGLNDDDAAARSMVALFRGFPVEVRFNLLPMNAKDGSTYRPSPDERVERFRAVLAAAGHFAMVRRARGGSCSAACGQLALTRAERERRQSDSDRTPDGSS